MDSQEPRAWYIVQTVSKHEEQAKMNIELRVESLGMQEYIFNVLVPKKVVREKKKNGEYKEIEVILYPKYIFIDMIVTDDTWFMVRNTPLVTGFLGSSGGGAKPVPVSSEEMQTIFDLMGIKEEDKTEFEGQVGDQVEIISGNFKGSEGVIESIDLSKKIAVVLISMFGRATPAELSFSDLKVKK